MTILGSNPIDPAGRQVRGFAASAVRSFGTSTLALTGLSLTLALTACRPDHRMSLDQFLERTRAAEQPPAPAEGRVAEQVGRLLQPLRVGPGDVVQVYVSGGDERTAQPTRVRVDRNGDVNLPVVGPVRILDMELEDAEQAIRRTFVPAVFKQASVHVELVAPETTNVLVVGAVTQAGLVPLRRTERNMLFAIVGAGGATDAASGRATLRRVRNPAESVTLDLTDPVQLREAVNLPPLEPGDIIHVAAAQPNMVFVGGLVHRTSAQTYPPGAPITVLQALAAAGGLRDEVGPTEGTLVRHLPDGSDAHVKLNFPCLQRGECPNIALAAGDILWVPDTFGTRVAEFINRNIFLRAGVSVNYNVSGVEFLNRNSQQNGSGGGSLQDQFDPLGFLNRNTLLQNINSRPSP